MMFPKIVARRSVRVLVVDDEPAIRHLLMRWLEQWGCTVVCVGSADEAIAHMELYPADVVFADIAMPIRDGLSLLLEVRHRWPQTVVIMETGDQDMSTVIRMQRFGARAYLPKPYGREEVRQALARAIETSAQTVPAKYL
jgi:DNA-binding NtrC family response regulator